MFICRYRDPQTEIAHYTCGYTIQESWENLLDMLESEYGISKSEIHFGMTQFFRPAEVWVKEHKIVWELSE